MAQSIYETLETLSVVTSVKGMGDYTHTIPQELFPSPETFEDGEKLLEWADENGYTHALLQGGITSGLIDIRAKFRSCKKSEIWSVELGQKNVDSHKWTVQERPNAAGTKKIDAAVTAAGKKTALAMKQAGLADDVILAALTSVHGLATAKEILSSL